MKTWANFYKNRITHSYYSYVLDKYQPFIEYLNEIILNNDYTTIVEAGCGICNITRALIERYNGLKFYAMDIDKKMLNLSFKNLLSSSQYDSNEIELIKGDILKEVHNGDIIHSHGVLEHFSDNDINQIITIQLKNAKELVHYVPSDKYKLPSFGDERLLTMHDWDRICKPTKITPFNDGYDLILHWKN